MENSLCLIVSFFIFKKEQTKEEANKKKVSFKIREITDMDNTINPLDNTMNPLDNTMNPLDNANAKENKLIDSILKNKTNDSPKPKEDKSPFDD